MPFTLGMPGTRDSRKTIRGPVNQTDKTTIFSIYPKPITVMKLTIQPGLFQIPAGSIDNPAHLVVGSSSWWKEIVEENQMLEVTQSSIQIAHSIVMDWMNGIFGCEPRNSSPGLFYIPGEHNPISGQVKHPELFREAFDKQNRYWDSLIEFADIIWATGNGNPALIMTEMRIAARERGAMDKDWMTNHQAVAMVTCFACGTFKKPQFPVCPACRAIDPSHPKASDIKFAG